MRTRRRRCAPSCGELLLELGLPTMLVTHDFEDAAVLAEQVGVISEGKILQVGGGARLHRQAPPSAFVASFTGGNLLHGLRPLHPREASPRSCSTGGAVVFSTDGAADVGVVVHPWEVSIAHTAAANSALNHVSERRSRSLVAIGNRVRVRVGRVVGEVTASSAEQLGLRRQNSSSPLEFQGDRGAAPAAVRGKLRHCPLTQTPVV